MRKPKCIIFDCDGVLIDSEILANRVEVEVKTELGFPITLEEQISQFAGCGMNHPVMIAEIARLPKEYLQMVDDRCDEVYAAELKPIDGVVETLELLRLPKCVASASEPNYLKMKLDLTDLSRFFPEAAFHGRLVERSKPAPDLFLYALKKMGWQAQDCLVVEDSEHGVRAGRAAGLRVCGFLGGGHVFPGHDEKLLKAGADFLISDMRKLLELIQ